MLKLAIDRQNRTLVNFGGATTSLPALFQSNSEELQIQVIDPTGNLTAPYSAVDLAGYGMRVSIGAPPLGTTGGSPAALQDAMVWNAALKYFTGTIALNTAAIDGLIGSASSVTAYLEVNLTINGTRITIFQGTLTIRAVVDELTATVPTPTDQYLTVAETKQQYVPRVMAPGDRIVIPSANGLYAIELGCNDDGTLATNVITL